MVRVGTLSLLTRQLVSILLDPIIEQILPIVQGENSDCEEEEIGFIRYCASALQEEADSGQHCSLEVHVFAVQSCTAPKIWADS